MTERPVREDRPRSEGLEFGAELFQLAPEHHDVEPNGGERRAPFDIAAGGGLFRGGGAPAPAPRAGGAPPRPEIPPPPLGGAPPPVGRARPPDRPGPRK